MTPLTDTYRRVIDYLRISIIDRCNLRCRYCMPPEGIRPIGHRDILSYEEILRVASIAAGLGVKKIRLTGGEPLLRKNITFLISSLKQVRGISDLSLTTNGTFLERQARELKDSGLDRVNVSIDSLRPDRYREITGGDLDAVLRGLDAAKRAGLTPVKINIVVMRGINDDEIRDFAALTLNDDLHVRFIELMPAGSLDFWTSERYMTADEVRGVIESVGPLSPVRARKNGPSKYFRLQGGKGVLGFISAVSHHFCGDCNRLRITAEGKLRPCLFSETEIDLKSALRQGAPDGEIERLLRLSVAVKPEGHKISGRQRVVPPGGDSGGDASRKGDSPSSGFRRPMSGIGG